jgi:hypothetical protein
MNLDPKILTKIAYLSRLKLAGASLLKSLEQVLAIAGRLPNLKPAKASLDADYILDTQPVVPLNKKVFWENVPVKNGDFIEVNAVFSEE